MDLNSNHPIKNGSKLKEDYKNRCCKDSSFHNLLKKSFYNLGFTIGKNPSYFIIIPIFVTLFCLTGVQRLKFLKDPDYLFTPLNGQGRADRTRIEKLFPLNYSENFDPSRNTRISHFVRLYVTSIDNNTMLRMEQWNELNMVDQVVRNVTFTHHERSMKYKDICAINKKKCNENKVLNLNRIMPQVANGSIKINYPIMLSPYVFPFAYGGSEVDEESGHLISTKSITLSYWTKQGGKLDNEMSTIWERNVVNTILAAKFKTVRVTIFASKSLEDELDRNTAVVRPYILGNIILMVTFSVLSIMAIDWVRSKFYLGFIAVVSVIFATITAFGGLMYLGVHFSGMNMAIPFLLLGIGLDDQFVILSAWHRTSPTKSVPHRMAEAYSEAGASITITSLTTMLSSFVGTTSTIPNVYYFTLYIGVCIFFLYLWLIFLYGGCLALSGYAEAEGRHSILCVKVKPISQSEEKTYLYKKLMSGGINQSDPYNEKDTSEQLIPVFFRDYIGAYLSKTPVKVAILLIFICYIIGAIKGLTVLEEGLERQNLLLSESYLGKFFNDEENLYRKYPYRIQIAIDQEIEYTDPENKKKLLILHDQIENSSYIGDRLFTTSWIRHFYRWIDRKPTLKSKIHDEISFINVLKNDYLPRRKNYQLDVTFNENETAVVGSRFIVQATWVNDSHQDKDMMQSLRKIAADAPFKTLIFHSYFPFFDQFLLIRGTTIQTVSIAAVVMMVVSLIFIPSKIACCGIAFSIVSIELGVVGYMSLWGVHLDALAMCNLIMCIGFSVDFSAHISYAFLTADASSNDERIKMCLYSLGLPVIQGGISTILAVILLSTVQSYVYKIFFIIIFLVIFFGIFHAIFLLPVLLSILSDISMKSNQVPNTSSITKATNTSVITDFEMSSQLSGRSLPKKINDPSSLDKELGIDSQAFNMEDDICGEKSTIKYNNDGENSSL